MFMRLIHGNLCRHLVHVHGASFPRQKDASDTHLLVYKVMSSSRCWVTSTTGLLDQHAQLLLCMRLRQTYSTDGETSWEMHPYCGWLGTCLAQRRCF